MDALVSGARLRALIEEELEALVALRRDLHRHPELGYEETRTNAVVRDELERCGIEFAGDLAGGTGILGHLPGAGDAAIALRADMDALPITEETGLEYASTRPGLMHACGHDGHVTMLVGAARVLAAIAKERELPRPVSLVFQPAEEGGAGGRRMVEDGCLDGSVIGPPIASMYGLHGWPGLALGNVGTRVGPLLAAADMFEITVRGTGAHAAFPHFAHDPIVAASAIVTAFQTIASRNVDPLDPIVVSTTVIRGGSAHNIIPEEVRLEGTVRTLGGDTQRMAMDRLGALAEHTAQAHGCTADVDYILGYPVTENHADAVGTFNRVATGALGGDRIVDVPRPFMGGEDFAFYCHQVPACFFLLGLLPPGVASMPQLHQPTFDFNDEALATGVELFCRLALDGA
ncbi:MAG: amidohydrolase [Planctomycetes bacterium]|nr:amidohydrolase [Planctomycetota bacterium]